MMATVGTRRFISITLTILFCFMVVIGKVSSEQMVPIYTMVLGFYFGKSTALERPDTKDVSEIKDILKESSNDKNNI